MSWPRLRAFAVCLLAIVALVSAWLLATRTQPARLIIRGFKVQKWSVATARSIDQHECIFAEVDLTNSSSHPISYHASARADSVEYAILYRTTTGWREPVTTVLLRRRPLQCILAPGQVIKFQAAVEKDKPCKVALCYDCESPVWNRLPKKFSRWLPIRRISGTLTTDVIDLRSTDALND